MKISKHASRDDIVGASVVQPLTRERITEFRNITAYVAQEHADAIGHLHVHVREQTAQDIDEVSAHAFVNSFGICLAEIVSRVVE